MKGCVTIGRSSRFNSYFWSDDIIQPMRDVNKNTGLIGEIGLQNGVHEDKKATSHDDGTCMEGIWIESTSTYFVAESIIDENAVWNVMS